MARFLALDWDHQQLQIVAATVGRGVVRIQRAAAWKEERSPNLLEAEELGKRLRERMKEAGISPAPALVCVGRDRVVLREVRYPAVPENEEPAIVRFQVVKELTEPAEEVVIDYTSGGESNGERRALALILRRELLATYQALCRAAGLKLVALTPRPISAVACLKNALSRSLATPAPEPSDGALAILSVTEKWAEFCVVRGEQLLLARSLPSGVSLVGEVRRNLAVYAGQSSQRPVRAAYVAGGDEQSAICQQLRDSLQIPVHLFDPLADALEPPSAAAIRSAFVGAVGLLHSQAERRGLPINFVHPKEPKPPQDPNKRRLLLGAAAAAALLLVAISFCYSQLAAKGRERDELLVKQNFLSRQLPQLEEDARRIKALDEWSQTEIVWLDELYELVDRFPDLNAAQLAVFQATANDSRAAKDKHTGRLNLTVISLSTDKDRAVNSLVSKLVEEPHYKVGGSTVGPNRSFVGTRFGREFKTQVDMEKRLPNQYVRQLVLPADPGVSGSNEGPVRPRAGNGRSGSGGGRP